MFLLISSGNVLCHVYSLFRSYVQPSVWARKPPALSGIFELGIGYKCTSIRYEHFNWNRHGMGRKSLIRASWGSGSTDSGRNVEGDEIVVKSTSVAVASKDFIGKMKEMTSSSPLGVFVVIHLFIFYFFGPLGKGVCNDSLQLLYTQFTSLYRK